MMTLYIALSKIYVVYNRHKKKAPFFRQEMNFCKYNKRKKIRLVIFGTIFDILY